MKGLTSDIYVKNDYLKKVFNNLNMISTLVEESSKEISRAMNEIAEGSISQADKTGGVLESVRDLDKKMNSIVEGMNLQSLTVEKTTSIFNEKL